MSPLEDFSFDQEGEARSKSRDLLPVPSVVMKPAWRHARLDGPAWPIGKPPNCKICRIRQAAALFRCGNWQSIGGGDHDQGTSKWKRTCGLWLSVRPGAWVELWCG